MLTVIDQCIICYKPHVEAYDCNIKIGMNICRDCATRKEAKKRTGLKDWAIGYKGGECQVCGYSLCSKALDFHHKDPSSKEFNITQFRKKDLEILKKELDKCILLCCRCHRELHEAMRVKESDFLSQKDRVESSQVESQCKQCQKSFKHHRHKKRIYCSLECSNEARKQATIDRTGKHHPSKEELQELIDTLPWTTIGKMFGVTDNAVRKWAKKYGIKRSEDANIKIKRLGLTMLLQPDGSKVCTSCHRKLLEQDFARDASQPDGLDTRCRGCHSRQKKEARALDSQS